MAELVDALVSGTSVRKDVQVRVLFQAPAFAKVSAGKAPKLTPNHTHTHTLVAQVVELVDTPA